MGIIGIAGEEQADTYKGAVFDFQGKTYNARRIAALPSEAQRRWRTRDGILGAGFFRRFVVQLDVPRRQMTLLEPEHFNYQGKGNVIPIRFKRDTPIIDAEIVPRGARAIKGPYEINTGCDGCICLVTNLWPPTTCWKQRIPPARTPAAVWRFSGDCSGNC